MSAPPRPTPPPHDWRFVGELDALAPAGAYSANVYVCITCWCVAAHVWRYHPEESVSFSGYGMDVDSLGIAHREPRCEVLRMPSAAEEPAGEALVA